MSKIYISVNDQELEITDANLIASGGVNDLTAVFSFSEEWDGYAKTAVFYANGDATNARSMVLDSENSCKVPWEVMTESGTLHIGIFGVKGDVTRTSNMVKIKIKQGTPRVETATSEPTPNVYEQLLKRLFGVHIGSDVPTDSSVMAWVDPDSEEYAVLRFRNENGEFVDVPAIKGKDGEDGQDGDDGYTPERGTDYWTEEDVERIKEYVDEETSGADVIAVTGSRELTAADAGKLLRVDAEATVTVPAGLFSVGIELEIFRNTSDAVTIAANGVSFAVPGNTELVTESQQILEQYGSIVLKQIGDNVWSLQGAI